MLEPVLERFRHGDRFAPEVCWRQKGNQKGAVENRARWVKGSTPVTLRPSPPPVVSLESLKDRTCSR